MVSCRGERRVIEEQMPARRPPWLRKQKQLTLQVMKVRKEIHGLGLCTVCESAQCPNLSECFAKRTATFMILGDLCTRNCGFCAVHHGIPCPPDSGEGARIASYMKEMDTHYCVITSVTRDDLPDGGAGHFVRVVHDIKKELPDVRIELLVPDFRGSADSIDRVAALPIEVFAHNVETVPRLYAEVRKGAEFARSLQLLERASKRCRGETGIKSGIMVGLGESMEEVLLLCRDLAQVGVSIVTIGQ